MLCPSKASLIKQGYVENNGLSFTNLDKICVAFILLWIIIIIIIIVIMIILGSEGNWFRRETICLGNIFLRQIFIWSSPGQAKSKRQNLDQLRHYFQFKIINRWPKISWRIILDKSTLTNNKLKKQYQNACL